MDLCCIKEEVRWHGRNLRRAHLNITKASSSLSSFLMSRETANHKDVVSNLSTTTWDGENAFSSSSTNRLRLFGIELIDPLPVAKPAAEGDGESVNSSSVPDNPPNSGTGKKIQCQYCLKEFANSQALGGHQNAHKKERMRKKRLQLQARKASLSYYYLRPSLNSLGYATKYGCGGGAAPWSYSQSFVVGHEGSSPSQISFSPPDQVEADDLNGWRQTYNALPANNISFRIRESHRHKQTIGLIRTDTVRSSPEDGDRSTSAVTSQRCKPPLDLQLSLGLQSNRLKSSS